MMDYVRANMTLAQKWDAVFLCMFRERLQLDPAHWQRFISSVNRGQRTPIMLDRKRRRVDNGHHRIWAMVLGSKGAGATVKVRFGSRR
jgi:hypothetical protein